MAYAAEQTGLEVLPLSKCVRHLEGHEVARVGYEIDGHVHVYPINYIWDGEAIVFRCEEGSSLARAAAGEIVIELDSANNRERSGWSIVARGTPQVVDPDETPELAARLERLAFYPWAAGEKRVWLRLIPAPLTGRSVPSATWGSNG